MVKRKPDVYEYHQIYKISIFQRSDARDELHDDNKHKHGVYFNRIV